jgi:hypothetical protein
MRSVRAAAFLLFCVSSLSASILYTVGPDSSFVPRSFTSITEAGVASPLFDLGDGSLGITGGVAYRAATNQFYAIANDSVGNSSLVSFSLAGAGAYTMIGSLGQGYVSGLAYSSAEDRLYAISTDSLGQSNLNWLSFAGAVNSVGVLGTGFNGGLAFRPSDGLLYAISGDAVGVQRAVQSVNPGTAAATLMFQLGDGSAAFTGGLAFSSADLFYTISSDWMGNSTLQSFTLGGGAGSLTPVAGIGGGFWNAGLADVTEVPEPSLWAPLVLLLAGLSGWLRRRPT